MTTVFTFPCVSFQIFYAHTRPHMYMYFSPSFLFLNTNGSKGYILFCASLFFFNNVSWSLLSVSTSRASPTFMAAQSLFLWLESVFCGQNVNYFYSFTTMRHCNTYPIINVILHTCMYYNQFPEGEMLGLFQTALQQDSTSSSAAATFPSAYITQS